MERGLLLLLAMVFVSVPGGAAPAADMRNTKHNLSVSALASSAAKATAETQVCVFCHTPYTADVSAPRLLWNKTLPASGGYSTYATLNSSTIDGTTLAVGSVSLACLSCHDGSQAMDNAIIAPGLGGGYDTTGGGATESTGSGTRAGVAAYRKMTNSDTTPANLGIDLSNDHPIGVQYCGGGPNAASPAAPCTNGDFAAPQNATINSNLVWWVDTAGGAAGTRQKSDMILYSRNFGGTNGPSVECASCHDPHAESGSGSPAAGATFLRISNARSAVCLACHSNK